MTQQLLFSKPKKKKRKRVAVSSDVAQHAAWSREVERSGEKPRSCLTSAEKTRDAGGREAAERVPPRLFRNLCHNEALWVREGGQTRRGEQVEIERESMSEGRIKIAKMGGEGERGDKNEIET